MDELTLLRELDADAPRLSQDARLAARARLEREIGRPPAPHRPRRPMNGQRAAMLLLALTVVGALVVVARDMGGGGDLTRSDLLRSEPAKDVLELAGRGREGLALPPTPRPDQYLYTREIVEATPLDPEGTPRTFVEEEWLAMAEGVPSRTCELYRCWMAMSSSSPAWPEELERIPREPQRLLMYARALQDPSAPSGALSETDWQFTYGFLFSLLRTPLIVPPDLRSAVVSALAYTPDASVVEELDFRGRPAAVISHPSWAPGTVIDRYTTDLIIDRDTHEYLGARWELGPADMNGRNGPLFNSSRVRLVSHLAEAAIVDRMSERP